MTEGEGAQETSAPGEGSEGQAATFPHEGWEDRGGHSTPGAAPARPAQPHAPQAAAQRLQGGGNSRGETAGDIPGTSHSQRQQTGSQDGSAFTVTPIQLGDIWGRGCGHHSCKARGSSWHDPLPAAGHRAGTWSAREVRAWVTISRLQQLETGTTWIYRRAGRQGLAQGRTSVSKVTLWYGAPGRFGPAGRGASDGQGGVCKQDTQLRLRKVTAREAMPQRDLPFPQGTNLPRNTTAGKTTLPKTTARGRWQPRGDLPAPCKQLLAAGPEESSETPV